MYEEKLTALILALHLEMEMEMGGGRDYPSIRPSNNVAHVAHVASVGAQRTTAHIYTENDPLTGGRQETTGH